MRNPLPPFPAVAAPSWSTARVQRAAFAALTVLLVISLLGTYTVEVLVEMRTTTGTDSELFFAAQGQDYIQARKVALQTVPDGKWRAYRVRIPNVQELARLRVDPAPGLGALSIRRIAVRTRHGTVSLVGGALHDAITATNELQPDGASRTQLDFRSVGSDPYLDFSLPPEASFLSLPGAGIFFKALKWGLAAGIGWFALELLLSFLGRRLYAGRLHRTLVRVADASSDEGVLRVTPGLVAMLAGCLLAFVGYVALDLHQSSIGMWEHVYPPKPVPQLVDIGTAKAIRTDEWNVHTPWMFSQVLHGDRQVNENVGGEKAPLLATVPVAHPAGIVQVKFLGFRLFDLETGFSWFWACRTFGLFLSFFWLLLVLTRGDIAVSAFGAAWIFASSFTQWWFSSGFSDILIASALAVVGGLYLLLSQRRAGMVCGGLLSVYGIANLTLHLYPPLIVALGYLGVFLIAGVLAEPGRPALARTDLRWRIGVAVVSAVVLGTLLGNYAADAWTTLVTMKDTAYPGRRSAGSGGVPLDRLFAGYFESYRYSEDWFPFRPYTNACEVSNFVVIAPFVLLALPARAYLSRAHALLISVFAYFVLVCLWVSVALPAPIERAMQAGGWSLVQPGRAIVGVGISSILFACIFFARVRSAELSPARWSISAVPLVVAGVVLAYGCQLRPDDPFFFSWKTIVTGTLASVLIVAGIVQGRMRLAVLGLVVSALPPLTVNPLVSGISALSEKPILLEAKRLGGKAGDKWVVFGDFVLAQGFKAHGLDVINGSHYVPNKEMAEVLDPERKFVETWNRYAHVVMYSAPDRAAPEFDLRSADLYVVSLDVCGHELRELGVTHVAYTGRVPRHDRECLEPLETREEVGVQLFRLKK